MRQPVRKREHHVHAHGSCGRRPKLVARPTQRPPARLRIWPVLPFLAYMIGAQIALRTIPNWTTASDAVCPLRPRALHSRHRSRGGSSPAGPLGAIGSWASSAAEFWRPFRGFCLIPRCAECPSCLQCCRSSPSSPRRPVVVLARMGSRPATIAGLLIAAVDIRILGADSLRRYVGRL